MTSPQQPNDQISATEPKMWAHPSGMRVVHRPLHTAPVVAVQLWVGTGSAYETNAQLGMAHVHEHMVFKGTAKRGVGQMADDVESAGGSINAWTSLEETVYHVVMPSNHGELGVDVLIDGLLQTAFDPTELERELEVIREEIRRGDDVPSRSHIQHLFELAWGEHPYGRPVIGSQESVSAFTAESLQAFHQQWYHPSNMVLVVVGDCQEADVQQWVDAAMPPLVVHPMGRPTFAPPAPRKAQTPIIEYREVENARVTVSFKGPSAHHLDYPAVEVLSMLLAGNNSSALYDRLVRKEKLALSAWSDVFALQEDGLVLTGATFSPETNSQDVVRVLAEELSQIAQRVRHEDLQRAKRAFEASHIMGETTVQGLGNRYGSSALHFDDPLWQSRWLDRLRGVTLSDIRRVARTYVHDGHVNIVAQMPIASKQLEVRPGSLMDAFHDGFVQKMSSAKVVAEPDAQRYQRMELENGLTLIVQPDRSLPLFNMSVGIRAGTLMEPEDKAGRTTMVAGLLSCGTRGLDTFALERTLDDLGTRIGANSGHVTTVLSAASLSDEQRASLALVHACWFESVFNEDEVERIKRVRLRGLKQQAESPGYLAYHKLKNLFFPDHPYSREERGTEETVSLLGREDMLQGYQQLLHPDQMVVSVVGDIDVALFVDKLSSWKAASETPYVVQPEQRFGGQWPSRERVDVWHKRKQAVVYVAYPGIGSDDPDVPVLSVLTSIMSGQGGRLFKELREKRSMAYSVSMGFDRYVDAGVLYGRMETSPEKVEDAICGMRAELLRLREVSLDVKEVDRAKSRLAGQMAVGLQRGGTRAAMTVRDELLGRGYRYGLDFADRIMDVDAQAIRRFVEKMMSTEHEVVVVARPEPV